MEKFKVFFVYTFSWKNGNSVKWKEILAFSRTLENGKVRAFILPSGSRKFESCKFSNFKIWKLLKPRFVRFETLCTTPTLVWCLRVVGRLFPSLSDSHLASFRKSHFHDFNIFKLWIFKFELFGESIECIKKLTEPKMESLRETFWVWAPKMEIR